MRFAARACHNEAVPDDERQLPKRTGRQRAAARARNRRHPVELPEVEKQFVNFTFLRVNTDWRKLDGGTKRAYKQEFERVFNSFRDDFLLFSYSLVGFDSKADLMFWRVGLSLDLIQEMTAKLYRTELGSYLETVDNYLSITKRMMFVGGAGDGKLHIEAGKAKYHFVYPCTQAERLVRHAGGGARCANEGELYGREAIPEHQDPPDARVRL